MSPFGAPDARWWHLLLLVFSNFAYAAPLRLLIAYELVIESIFLSVGIVLSFWYHACREPFHFCMVSPEIQRLGDVSIASISIIVFVFSALPALRKTPVPPRKKGAVYIGFFALNLAILWWLTANLVRWQNIALNIVVIGGTLFYFLRTTPRATVMQRIAHNISTPWIVASIVLLIAAPAIYVLVPQDSGTADYAVVHSAWHLIGAAAIYTWLRALKPWYGIAL